MTSKEALELIKLDYGVEPQGYELIKSALELLEFLKNNLTLVYGEEGMVLLGKTLNDEELETIERWLK